jgi:hypothetical protein
MLKEASLSPNYSSLFYFGLYLAFIANFLLQKFAVKVEAAMLSFIPLS